MNIEQRIKAFAALGKHLAGLSTTYLEELSYKITAHNLWFTKENIQTALQGIIQNLALKNLENWLKNYHFPASTIQKKVGVVMAGNIPAVGFHDFLCVLLSGHQLYAKLSTQDSILIKEIANHLIEIDPYFESQIHFVDRLNHVDAVIATGSDNTARYFHYYFSKIPHIIRKTRNSIGILNGKESPEALNRIGKDIFLYFGLGCRNVSKLYLPEGYKLDSFLDQLTSFQPIINHHKYANNYTYYKSIYLVNQVPHLDNGFVLLKEDEAIASPVAVLYYEFYKNEQDLATTLSHYQDKIQCIVSDKAWYPSSIPFGEAQFPQLWDYADGVDTMQFLLEI